MSTIKNINLTERQKELLAEFAQSEHFKVLRDVVFPQRQDEVAKAAVNLTDATSLQNVHLAQGEMMNLKWFVGFIKEAGQQKKPD